MAKRFYRGKSTHTGRRLLFSAVLFLCIGCLFYYGVVSVSQTAEEEQRQSLEDAIQRGVTHCYAVEGQYPESLDYLKKEYGIQYDKSKYFVDYQILGANIMPDITIIEK